MARPAKWQERSAALEQQLDITRRRLERSSAMLDVLYKISLAARGSTSFQAIFAATYRELRTVFPLDACYLALCDAAQPTRFRAVLTVDEGVVEYLEDTPYGVLTGLLLQQRTTLLFQDLVAEGAQYGLSPERFGNTEKRSRAWLGVPMLVGQDAVGVISIQSYTPGLYDASDRDLLQRLGNLVALALENVSLAQRQQALGGELAQQVRARTEELSVLGAVARELVLGHPLPVLLDHALGLIVPLLGLDGGAVRLVEQASGQLRLVAQRGLPADYAEQTRSLPIAGSLLGSVVSENRPLLIDQGLPGQPRLNASPPFESMLSVPLRIGERVAGTLSLLGAAAHRFDQVQLDLAQAIANQIAIAVENAELFEEQQLQIAELQALGSAAQASAAAAERQAHRMQLVHRVSLLLSSRLDQQEILDLASRELVALFWADHTGTVLFDSEQSLGIVAAEYPRCGVIGQRFALEGNLLCDELVHTQRPVYIADAINDPRSAVSAATFRQLGIASMMVVPLIARGRVIGSISLESMGATRVFTDEEQALFMTVASSIASAVENARLFAAEQAARRSADTLREVARVISSSFNPDEVLELILGELERVVPYDSASIMLLDGQTLRVAALNSRGDLPRPQSVTFRIDQTSGAAMAVRRREPVMIADTRDSPFWRRGVGDYVRSWLGVPLISRGVVLGLLNINACETGRFSMADVETARAFAHHSAVALENARLYQESVTRVEQEMQIARQIQSNLFPRVLPLIEGLNLAAECRPARETGGDFYDFVALDAGRLALMVGDASGKSIPGAMLMAVARSIARSEARDHEAPREVMLETNRWIADDVPYGSFVAFCYAVLDLPRRRLTLSNAGQLSPMRRSADGSLEYLEVPGERLPLGITAAAQYAEAEVALSPGDTLVFYTDGIVEAHSPAGELFGFERLEELLRQHGDQPPHRLIATVMDAVDAFADSMPQHDDMTLVVLCVA